MDYYTESVKQALVSRMNFKLKLISEKSTFAEFTIHLVMIGCQDDNQITIFCTAIRLQKLLFFFVAAYELSFDIIY